MAGKQFLTALMISVLPLVVLVGQPSTLDWQNIREISNDQAEFDDIIALPPEQLSSLPIRPASVAWIRFTVTPEKAGLYVLSLTAADEIDLYLQENPERSATSAKNFRHIAGGNHRRLAGEFRRPNSFLVELNKGKASYTGYIRLKTNFISRLYQPHLSLVSVDQFNNSGALSRNLQLSFVVLFFFIFLYHLSLFIITQFKAYLLHAAYCLLVSVFRFFSYYLPEDWGITSYAYQSGFVHILSTLFVPLSVLFGQHLLNTKENYPRWHRALNAIKYATIAMVLLVAGAEFYLKSHLIAADFYLPIIHVPAIVCIIAFSVSLLPDKNAVTRCFMLGNTWLYGIMLIAAFSIIYNNNQLASILFYLSFIGEVLLFALGIGFRMREIEKNRLLAQSQLIEQYRLNEELNTKVTRELEQRVQERTAEIEQQKKLIEEKNDEILTQNEELQAQSEELLTQRDVLNEQNLVIEQQNQELQRLNNSLEAKVADRSRELRRSNDQLIKANAELQTAIEVVRNKNEQITEFAYLTAHHLRGPVARAKGLTHLITHSFLQTPEVPFAIEKIEQSLCDVDEVIHDMNQILDLHAIPADDWKSENVKIMLADCLDKFKNGISASDTLKVTVDDSIEIITVAHHFKAIIAELVANAIKFNRTGSPLTLEIDVALENEKTKITVRDFGRGIDLPRFKEKMFKLYQRFYLDVQGKGIGLYLVKQLALMLKAEVMVDSRLNQYTSFTLYFDTKPKLVT